MCNDLYALLLFIGFMAVLKWIDDKKAEKRRREYWDTYNNASEKMKSVMDRINRSI